jgi:sugar lactone lactonase YvrE
MTEMQWDEREWRWVVGGLGFPEAPRWHDGRLYVSEIFGGQVIAVDDPGAGGFGAPGSAKPESGKPGSGAAAVEVIIRVPGRPSGLGWRPDGTLLVVSMHDRRLLAVDASGTTTTVADVAHLAGGDTNDMVVDARGRAYLGNFGYDYAGGEVRRAAQIVLVDATGAASVVAEDVWFPNGMVVTPDGTALIVAETPAERLTAFTINADGSLRDRRLWAALTGAQAEAPRPDGLTLDAEGAIWVASPGTGELLRVAEGGRILDGGRAPRGAAQACALGGPDGRTLYVCSSLSHEPDDRRGAILATRVEVPAAC